jgi:hypothetical protein
MRDHSSGQTYTLTGLTMTSPPGRRIERNLGLSGALSLADTTFLITGLFLDVIYFPLNSMNIPLV